MKVVAIDRTTIDGKVADKESDTLTHWVRFDVHPEFELVKGTEELLFRILNPTAGAKSRLSVAQAHRKNQSMMLSGSRRRFGLLSIMIVH